MKSLPLYKQIQQDIRRLITIGQLREGDRVPSEKELATQYRVSQITSKNALLGLMEEGLLVRIQGKGTFVMRRSENKREPEEQSSVGWLTYRSGRIGLVLPTMKTKVDQLILDEIERHATAAGYEVLLRITRESQQEESRVIASFLKQGVDGIIIFPVENETYNDSILRLSLDRFPFVFIDRYLKGIKCCSVSADNTGGMRQAVESLIAKGHTSIALISPEITNTVTDERAAGFEQVFLERKASIDKNLWCMLPLELIASGAAERLIAAFLQERPHVTAAVTANTELCRYAWRAVQAGGKTIPRDMELVTFDLPELPGVSYIRQDIREMCKLTMALLVEQMNGEQEHRQLVVPVSYVEASESNFILNKIY